MKITSREVIISYGIEFTTISDMYSTMTTTGLIPGSFKPLHAGHFKLIEIAANENDVVYVYVSLSDRAKPGEMPVYGSDMETIWKNYVDPYLPANVVVEYVTVPVKAAWETLINAEESSDVDTVFTIYGDVADITSRFSEDKLMKYVPSLVMNDQVITRPTERASTVDVSGTKMRQWIASQDKESFMRGMPSEIDRESIWNILSKRSSEITPMKKKRGKKNESIIREAVTTFEEWLSPDVMDILISNFAVESPLGRKLKWSYAKLPARVWGMYVPSQGILYVNKAKTRNLFKQQVQTILHEIQHWNQHVEFMKKTDDFDYSAMIALNHWKSQKRMMGYWNSSHEVDARRFADENIQTAMKMISEHYSGKVEGMSIDDVIEEFFEEYAETRSPIKRRDIGETLMDYGLNNAENMKLVLQQLKELGVKIAI